MAIERVEGALRAEIAALIAKGIDDAELTTARNQTLAARLTERETASGKAQALGYAATLLGDPERANFELTEIESVTAAQVREAAAKWLADTNWLTIEYLPASMKAKGKAKK